MIKPYTSLALILSFSWHSTIQITRNHSAMGRSGADTIKTFTVDDYPVPDKMFGSDLHTNAREIKSGPVRSQDKVWFSNAGLGQTLVFELYTDNFRNVTFDFFTNDVPPGLIKIMELTTSGAEFAPENLKRNYFSGFTRLAKPIAPKYFTTDKGFRLGDKKAKAIEVYGKPDKKSLSRDIETCEWDFVGDAFYDKKMNLKGKPLAKDNFGHQVTMFFRNDQLIAIILHNDIP
jgi:hypothetical protein